MADALAAALMPIGVPAALSAGLAAALVAAIRYRAEAIRWRRRAAHWRTRANVGRHLLRSCWARKCGPDIDRPTAGRILAVLTRSEIPPP